MFSVFLLIGIGISLLSQKDNSLEEKGLVLGLTQTAETKNTDTEFNEGSYSSTEVSGTGSGALVELQGDGGTYWFDPDYDYRKLLTVTTQDSVTAGYTVFLTENLATLVSGGKPKVTTMISE